MNLKPRPTVYKGIAMRSRLEARFAAYLDAFDDWAWKYEPRAYAGSGGQYLPDFEVIPGPNHKTLFFEVKPTVDSVLHAAERMRVIWESVPGAILFVAVADGSIWIVGADTVTRMSTSDSEWAYWE